MPPNNPPTENQPRSPRRVLWRAKPTKTLLPSKNSSVKLKFSQWQLHPCLLTRTVLRLYRIRTGLVLSLLCIVCAIGTAAENSHQSPTGSDLVDCSKLIWFFFFFSCSDFLQLGSMLQDLEHQLKKWLPENVLHRPTYSSVCGTINQSW